MKNKLTKIERNDTINANKRSKEKKMQEILEGLNNKQYEAVTNYEGPCLVIAGAGSRKNKSINT